MLSSLRIALIAFLSLSALIANASTPLRQRINFNAEWHMHVGDLSLSDVQSAFPAWQSVTLPHAFNEDEAFAKSIEQLTDTVAWYVKSFSLSDPQNTKTFLELEGVRFAAEVYVNGHKVGTTENGVMASGYDLSPFVVSGQNILCIRVDSDWKYHEVSTGSRYQWNDKNFNANYGGIPKNVVLHITPLVYQTLPLYSNLRTVGTYVYASNFDIPASSALISVESQVRNESLAQTSLSLHTEILDADGRQVASFDSNPITLAPGRTQILKASKQLSGLHFWSWGYGYLYTVRTSLRHSDGALSDVQQLRTGFRKTEFANGLFRLNDRALMIHGYAQRTSNEWPALGMSVPAWLSDYSNHLMVQSGGNLVRWMHVCPWKQDVESCDRVGLLQAMPAGDAEKDVDDRRWQHRVDLMRDAIIYNRNNPSVVFIECGNRGITPAHFAQMKALRDEFDPHGGRAIGSREMLDVDESEYGGEMLYVNKSASKPMWMMEYCRDEGLRKYWDEYSAPYHAEGEGPLYRGKPADEYNHNMDNFAVKLVTAWHDYFLERPGTGRRVNSGGVKIVFSDTNTHYRGESNYRTSGVVDALRIPKDAFFAHQVMWDGWITPEQDRTHLIGHWNYSAGVRKNVYAVSTADSCQLILNGNPIGWGTRSAQYLFTFPNVDFVYGTLICRGYRNGAVVTSDTLTTAGTPHHIVLTPIVNPLGFKADGADVALVQVEVVDKNGRRCPLDNSDITFFLAGPAEWRGGIASRHGKWQKSNYNPNPNAKDKNAELLDGPADRSPFNNYILAQTLPVECGVNRVIIRSTTTPGRITIRAKAKGLKSATLTLNTQSVQTETYAPAFALASYLDRGPTPSTPSFVPVKEELLIESAVASNQADAHLSYDDNEASAWSSDSGRENAFITYSLATPSRVDEVVLKPVGWRTKSYPIEILANDTLVWRGFTYPTLGYVHIRLPRSNTPVRTLTIRAIGPSTEQRISGDQTELAGGVANQLDRIAAAPGKVDLRLVEVSLLRDVEQ